MESPKFIKVKRREWFDENENYYNAIYFRVLEELSLLEYVETVISHNRFIIYKYPENINIEEIIALLKTIPEAKTVKAFEQHGWKKTQTVVRGGYWSGNDYVNSIKKGKINWRYTYAENLKLYKRSANNYIEYLKAGPKLLVSNKV